MTVAGLLRSQTQLAATSRVVIKRRPKIDSRDKGRIHAQTASR